MNFLQKSRIIKLTFIAAAITMLGTSFRPDEGMFPLNYLNITDLKNAGLKYFDM